MITKKQTKPEVSSSTGHTAIPTEVPSPPTEVSIRELDKNLKWARKIVRSHKANPDSVSAFELELANSLLIMRDLVAQMRSDMGFAKHRRII